MKLSVVYQPAVPAGTSPYRVRDEQGRELDWANVFLDGQRLRQPDFIRREDFPVQPRYLPRPLSLQEDQLLQQELKRTDNLVAMRSCSCAPLESASASASIYLWTACGS